jgi:hypothetical protein
MIRQTFILVWNYERNTVGTGHEQTLAVTLDKKLQQLFYISRGTS